MIDPINFREAQRARKFLLVLGIIVIIYIGLLITLLLTS